MNYVKGAMKRHLSYLKYVLRHKWFVLVASRRIGASLWLALIHDMSKFQRSEWGPYAYCFYRPDGSKRYLETPEFNRAWLFHQHRNPHHHQFWLLKTDSGSLVTIEMPRRYVYEMVADWMGAGRAITGRWECKEWYNRNQAKILLHERTRTLVEYILGKAQ